jgi:hypothetical protein
MTVPHMFALMATGGAGGFSPLDVSGLQAWYDASDTATITDTSNNVTGWADKSGNGRDLTSPSAGIEPLTNTQTLNGLNVLELNGDAFMNSAFDVDMSSKALTFVAVFDTNRTNITSQGIVSLKRSSAFDFYGAILDRRSANQGFTVGDGSNASFSLTRLLIRRFADSNIIPECIVARADVSALTIRRDGANQTLNTEAGTMAQSSFLTSIGSNLMRICVGGRLAAADNTTQSDWYHGTIAEILVYDEYISDGDAGLLETYLMDKWGI